VLNEAWIFIKRTIRRYAKYIFLSFFLLLSPEPFFKLCKFLQEFALRDKIQFGPLLRYWRAKVKVDWTLEEPKSSCHALASTWEDAPNVIKSSLWPRLVCCGNLPLIASRYGMFRENIWCIGEPLSSRARKHIKELRCRAAEIHLSWKLCLEAFKSAQAEG